jgi:hypothetical protein
MVSVGLNVVVVVGKGEKEEGRGEWEEKGKPVDAMMGESKSIGESVPDRSSPTLERSAGVEASRESRPS